MNVSAMCAGCGDQGYIAPKSLICVKCGFHNVIQSACLDDTLRIYFESVDDGQNSIAGWVSKANLARIHFSDNMSLSDDQQFEEVIDDIQIPRSVDLEKIINRVQLDIPKEKLEASIEQLSIFKKGILKEENIRAIVFYPEQAGNSMDLGLAGSVNIACRLIFPQVGMGRITVVLYAFFCPKTSAELGDLSYQDYNVQVKHALIRSYPISSNRSVCEEIEALKKSIVSAVREELHKMSLGASSF